MTLRALAVVWRCSRGLVVATLALALLQGILPPAVLYSQKLVLDRIQSGGYAWPLVVGAACSLVYALVAQVGTYVNRLQGHRVTAHVTDLIHAKSVALDLGYYETPAVHEQLYRAQQQAAFRPADLVHSASSLLNGGVGFASMAALLLGLDPWLALVMTVAGTPLFYVLIRDGEARYNMARETTALQRLRYYLHHLLTGTEAAKEVRAYGLQAELRLRYRQSEGALNALEQRHEGRALHRHVLAHTLAVATLFALVYYTVTLTAAGSLTLGGLMLYWGAFVRGSQGLKGALSAAARMYQTGMFVQDLFNFLDLQPRFAAGRGHPGPRFAVRACGVHFGYPGGEAVLEGVDLDIQPGERVALVGANGCGKSTFTKLLCGFYQPSRGRILFGEHDLAALDAAKVVSACFQDFVRYDLSVRDNVDLAAHSSDAAIRRALRQSTALSFVEHLGLDTVLGKQFERSRPLSVGQWQRLALARAILKPGALVILDEPSSHMDAAAEQRFFEGLDAVLDGRSLLLVSHRLSSIRACDRVFVLEGGVVAESGSHSVLVSQSARYRDLFAAQLIAPSAPCTH
jgi:ATP-binding cassette subfamily B protein